MLSLTVTSGSEEIIHDTGRLYLRLSPKSVGLSTKLLRKQFYGWLFVTSVTVIVNVNSVLSGNTFSAVPECKPTNLV
jgi:hypothetical protein